VGGEGAAATVHGFLADPDPNVVIAACEALAVMRDVSAASLLVDVLARRDAETGPAAQETLERVTGQRLGASLLKWRQWLRERGAAQAKAKTDAYDAGEKYEPDYGRPYQVPLSETAVDLVVVYDTTGSLGKLWPEVSADIDAVLAEMAARCHSLRLGTVRYRSDNTQRSRYRIQPLPLTRDLKRARDNILDASFGGGSGGLHLGLRHAVSAFLWRAHARKVVLIVGDVTPVGDGLKDCLKVIYEGRELDRIYFNCVFIHSAHGEEHRPAYSRLAEVGAGRFYEFDRAERHLVDRSEAKVNPRVAEQPVDTLKKWMTPYLRESVQK
jgi:hypothetical protein